MLVNYEEALSVFASLPAFLRVPGLHPFYVFTDALCNQEFEACFFVYREKEKVFYHAFHLGKVGETGYFDVQSPYGYGGPIANTSDRSFLQQAETSYVNWCKENNVLAEFVRFHPLLENWVFYGGVMQEDRQTVWIDVSSDIWSNYSVRVRTAVRKAYKHGLKVEWLKAVDTRELVNTFISLYFDFLQSRSAPKEYYFCTEYFSNLLKWENSWLALCRYSDEIVAGAVFLQEGSTMEYHLSASTHKGKNFAATNLILHEAALMSRQLGCTALHLGGGTDSSPNNSLLFFKAGFSTLRAKFNIGWRIYDPRAYEMLRLKYQQERGSIPAKILFYRF